MSEVKQDAASKGDSKDGFAAASLTKSLLAGVGETFGLPNLVNLLELPNVKSDEAALNFGLGLLAPPKEDNGPEDSPLGAVGDAIGLPGIRSLLPQVDAGTLNPLQPAAGTAASGQGLGPAPGPTLNFNFGNVGFKDVRDVQDNATHQMNQSLDRHLGNRGS